MIELKGKIYIPKEAFERAQIALEHHIRATRKEASNLVFEVTHDQADPYYFHMSEKFEDEASFARHQRLGKARKCGRMSKAFKREYQLRNI